MFVLKKACSKGNQRRCYVFETQRILEQIRERRETISRYMERTAPNHNLEFVDRCAVVFSGHTLRCGSRVWAPLLDGNHYDLVMRANMQKNLTRVGISETRAASIAGRRVDFFVDQDSERCSGAAKGSSPRCVPVQLRKQLDTENVTGRPLVHGGLGAGR